MLKMAFSPPYSERWACFINRSFSCSAQFVQDYEPSCAFKSVFEKIISIFNTTLVSDAGGINVSSCICFHVIQIGVHIFIIDLRVAPIFI